ncbi:MAG: PilZ domain-containing protein [Planctomycetota bacterium]
MIDRDRIVELHPLGRQTAPVPVERRRHTRSAIARACKVQLSGAVRYEPATTIDVSESGARLYIDSQRPLEPGQRLLLAVAWDAQPTLRAGSAIPARVVRADDAQQADRRSVAVEFETPIALPARIEPRRAA